MLVDEEPVRIGSRAMDLLVCLIGRQGRTVAQDELIKTVWPYKIAGENTLRAQIKTLRRALARYEADHYIVNRSGRGYAFVAPGSSVSAAAVPRKSPPPAVERLIGRTAILSRIAEDLDGDRLVSLVGPGGIGKTAVALSIAHRTGQRYADGVHFIDFSGVGKPRLALALVARSLGLPISERDPSEAIAQFLADRHVLIIFDTCEHVVETIARLSDLILAGAPKARILTTTREALCIRRERVRHVEPLALPQDIFATTNLRCPAVELFYERAIASGAILEHDEPTVRVISEICIRLDGLPLAIELAAARVEELGLEGILAHFGERSTFLVSGFRTAAPRQQTMQATLDWSYRLLAPQEQCLLTRLAVFQSPFTAKAAFEIACANERSEVWLRQCLHHLFRKSLLNSDFNGNDVVYRMLDTTRAYALEKLTASELAETRRRHAYYSLQRLTCSAERGSTGKVCDHDVNEVQAALDWCWETGERSLAVELTLSAIPAWFERSLIDECKHRVEQAIAALEGEALTSAVAMKLYDALGSALMNIEGAGPSSRSAWLQVHRISGRLRDVEHRLRALWGLWVDARNRGHYRSAVRLAERFRRLSRSVHDLRVKSNSDRMMGISLFFFGRFDEARTFLERALAIAEAEHRTEVATFQFDQRITVRCFLAQILWLQGSSEQALALAARNVEDAIALGHPGSLSYALTEGACAVAMNAGNYPAAARFTQLVLQRTAGKGMEVWHTIGECFDGMLKIHQADPEGLLVLRKALAALRINRFGPIFTRALGEYALALSGSGRPDEADAAIGEAIQRARDNGEEWCLPELLRIRAVVSIGRRDPKLDFIESLNLACRQNAVAWQLKTLASLASYYKSQNHEDADKLSLLFVDVQVKGASSIGIAV